MSDLYVGGREDTPHTRKEGADQKEKTTKPPLGAVRLVDGGAGVAVIVLAIAELGGAIVDVWIAVIAI